MKITKREILESAMNAIALGLVFLGVIILGSYLTMCIPLGH